ncbi:type VI secretion system tube protein Hcp [Pirellulaceae bacterium SH467]
MKSSTYPRRHFWVERLEARQMLASDFLLEIEGIKGESSDAKLPYAIELDSFSWGGQNPTTSPGRAPVAELTSDEFRFVSSFGKASPQLAQSVAQGKHFPKASLHVRNAGSDGQSYLKIELQDVMISSIYTRSLNEEKPKEEVSIQFSKLEQTFSTISPDGAVRDSVTRSLGVPKNPIKFKPPAALLDSVASSNLDQSDAFLQIDGIKGEVSDTGVRDGISIESFSWGFQASGQRNPTDAVSMQDMHFVTSVSKASPTILQSVATGKHIPQAVLIVRQPQGHEFLKIKLTDILVTSYRTAGDSSSETLEEFTFSFKSMNQMVSLPGVTGERSQTITTNLRAAVQDDTAPSQTLMDRTTPERAGGDFLLEIDGIKGESADAKHKGSIQIESFSWGLSQSGGTGSSGKVSLQDFHFVSTVSKASPSLMQSVAKGEHIKLATLSVRKSGESTREYLKIELENVLVSSYSVSSQNNSAPSDRYSLNFTKIKFDYQPVSGTKVDSRPTSVAWTVPASARTMDEDPVFLVSNEGTTKAGFDAFLEIDGIKGETSNSKHKGEIEILSFSWGLSQSGTGRVVDRSGKVAFQDFHFVTPTNSLSPLLVNAIADASARGKHIAKAVLFVRKSGGDSEFIKWELNGADVSHYAVRALNHTQPIEEVGLQFDDIRITHRGVQDPTGASTKNEQAISVRPRDTFVAGEELLDVTEAPASAVDYLLEIDGIKGESSDSQHKGSISIESFSWGMSNHPTTGGSGGKVSMQDFHFVRPTDASSPDVFRALAQGKHFSKAVLMVRKSSERPQEYLKWQMEDLLVSSYRSSGQVDSLPLEEFSLNFGTLKGQFSSQSDSGVATKTQGSFDVSELPGRVAIDPSTDLLIQTTPSPAKSSYFLKLDAISSDSVTRDHKHWIPLEQFSWGASRRVEDTKERELGELQWSPFEFESLVDRNSPSLMSLMGARRPQGGALLEIVLGEGRQDPYLKYKLTDILVSSYSISSAGGGSPQVATRLRTTGVTWDWYSPTAGRPQLATFDRQESRQSDSTVDNFYAQSEQLLAPKVTDLVYAAFPIESPSDAFGEPSTPSANDEASTNEEATVHEFFKSFR